MFSCFLTHTDLIRMAEEMLLYNPTVSISCTLSLLLILYISDTSSLANAFAFWQNDGT